MNTHKISPATGDGSVLVASVTADRVSIDRPWAAELAEFEHANRERDMRSLGFGQRASLCG